MDNPKPEKVAVVDELKTQFANTDATILTEYRGLDVAAMAELRKALRAAGGEYKIYKNTLIAIAARDSGLDIDSLLVGPTALAFVKQHLNGDAGDVTAVAKALCDFAKTNQSLLIKGGVVNNQTLNTDSIKALAVLPNREVLLAQLARTFAAPLTQFAGLLEALPRGFAYALSALIENQQTNQEPKIQEEEA